MKKNYGDQTMKFIATNDDGQTVFEMKNGEITGDLSYGINKDRIIATYNRHLILGENTDEFMVGECLITVVE